MSATSLPIPFYRNTVNRSALELRSHGYLDFHRFGAKGIHVVEKTGPLASLTGKRVLGLIDDENFYLGARDLGCKISFRSLAHLLKGVTSHCWLHAFFSRRPGDQRREEYFVKRGYRPHPRDIELISTHLGPKASANSDERLIFTAGVLVSRSAADVVLIGSGDGVLVSELATAIATLQGNRKVVSLSLAGSTSQRLNASNHRFIDENIEIGLDVMYRIRPQA